MKTAMLSSVLVTLVVSVLVVCRAVPVQPPFADEKAENDSQDMNEVGPDEDWKLYNQISKTQSYDSADEEKTKKLMKEIEEFTRLVSTPQPPPPQTYNNIADDGLDGTTLENEPGTETEHDYASSDWFASTWRTQLQNRNDDGMLGRQEEDDAAGDDGDMGNVEEIIKKIRKDLKKLYKKIKEVVKVVKNWVNSKRGSLMREYDGQFPMSSSASESDGVFVIAEPLIGDTDKSNKYTVPISAD